MFLCSPSQADHAHRKVFPLSANRFPRLYLFGTFELDVLEAGSWQGTRRYEGGSKGLQHQKSQHATVAQAPCTAGSIDKCNIINALKSFSRFGGADCSFGRWIRLPLVALQALTLLSFDFLPI